MKYISPKSLKKSRYFFDKKPPNFIMYFIWFFVAMLFITVLLLNQLSKNYVVSGEGTVVPKDRTYISVSTGGYIKSINFHEGEYVEKGDIIIELVSNTTYEDIEILEVQLKEANEFHDALNLYQESLDTGVNLLDKNNDQHLKYYEMVEYYLDQIDTALKENNKEADKLHSNNTKISENNTKITSLKSEITYLSDELQNINNELSDSTTALTEEELQELTDQKITLESNISEKNNEIDSLNSQNDSLKSENEEIDPTSSSAVGTYQQLISELGIDKINNIDKISQLEAEIEKMNLSYEKNLITADADGYIHFTKDLKVGLSIQSQETIIEISQNNKNEYIVEAFISSTEITKIKIGDDVKIEIIGVNQSKYGSISGVLQSVSNGTYVDNDNNSFYKVIVKLDDTYVSDKNDVIELSQSLPVRVNVIYDSESYLEWIIEKLNFKN